MNEEEKKIAAIGVGLMAAGIAGLIAIKTHSLIKRFEQLEGWVEGYDKAIQEAYQETIDDAFNSIVKHLED